MALFLVVLGGAAVVEVHRAITGGGKNDIRLLREREETLRRQLMDIQKELEDAKSQRVLTEEEASKLAAINAQLQQDKEELEKARNAAQAEAAELTQRAERLLERQQLLEQCAESLKLENSILIQQFDRLKVKYEQESAAFQEQIQVLKERVSASLQAFTAGEMTAEALTEALAETGVELHFPQEQLQQLSQRLATATTVEERAEALDKVELKVDENWLHQMRLVTSSPTRAARLLMNATTHRAAPAPAAEQRPLMTPRSLEAAEQNAAALKLTSHAVAAETEAADTIPAVHAVQEAVAVEVAAAPEAEPKQANKARSLVFRPMKKAAKMALSKKQAVVEVDVPFQLTSSAELEGPSSGALVAV